MTFRLVPHPARPPRTVASVEVEMEQGRLRYRVAPTAGLRIPPATAPDRADGLWTTTCFELFVRPAGQAGYFEFNFSPSGAWAAYAFDGYRSGMRELPLAVPPAISREGDGWLVAVDLSNLPGGEWAVALTAVIEETDGAKSYWSLAHPAEQPDFHHRACFAATIPAPR